MSIPDKIKAIQYTAAGGPEVIALNEIDTPKPKEDELLVKVEYAGVNFIDTYQRSGIYAVQHPYTGGQEAAGEIVSLPTSPAVLESDEYKKRDFKIGDKVCLLYAGSFKSYTTVPWVRVVKIPSDISTKIAAAGFLQGLTALTALKESYKVKKGDWILIHTIAGGLGLQLLQIAKLFGANVIGTTSSSEKAETAKSHGADHVLLYTKGPIIDEVLKITNGVGVQAVIDGVGRDTWEANFKLIARKGTIVSIGGASGPVLPFPPSKLAEKNVTLLRPTLFNYLVTPEETRTYFTEYIGLIQQGLKIEIHKEYPFTAEGVREAQADITGRGTVGKLVIAVGGQV